jgi:mono/diheme cytochrome c family protein
MSIRTSLGLPVLTLLVLSVAWGSKASAQDPVGKTVADGVYTDAQAVRGLAAFEAACQGCHRANLLGADGPALRDERFARNFAGKDLKTLYTKIASTMPRATPGSLGDNVYLDIVAHLLRENGFPSGSQELSTGELTGIQVLPTRPKPRPPVGDFSYVETVGCLVPGAGDTWTLTSASEPVTVEVSETGPAASTDKGSIALGEQTFHLLDARAYAPDAHQGHKVYVRGLLITLPSERRMTISALEMIGPRCQ